ncbi:MAG: HD domain-containing phosphohydrolase [Dissulfurimicrobium sp.]|uniref:HD domain-containing phosphohydrolase n=1 Tax=Dissulfurimicrobium sp. TaxID=2022436 RepID=UPI00404A851D
MRQNITINLGNLLLSLSNVMDLASPSLMQHQQRTAFVVWKMGKAARLSNDRIEKIFTAALLHDIGALSLEEKILLHNYEVENLEEHLVRVRGVILLNSIPWLKDSAEIIRFHHKEWRHWEEPIETPIVFESQLLFLADYLERAIKREIYILHQHENIISKLKSLSGSLLHPQVVDLFMAVSHREEFWLDLVSPKLYSLLFHQGPLIKTQIDFSDILKISNLFRNIIDFRSPFTSTHSSGVAASASMLARFFGFTDTEIKLLEVAGNLHDIGKLVIPNSILNKPGKLTKEEMLIIKSHPYYTYNVINAIEGLNEIAEWAAFHHEKLDGSGYPFHCVASELSTEARIIMVADIFTALIEDRPYRKKMPKNEVVKIIKEFSDRGLLDNRIVNILFENYDEIYSYVTERQSLARELYEKQFASI